MTPPKGFRWHFGALRKIDHVDAHPPCPICTQPMTDGGWHSGRGVTICRACRDEELDDIRASRDILAWIRRRDRKLGGGGSRG